VRLGQAHGGQPFAGGDLFQVERLQLGRGVVLDAFVGAVQQAGRHGPAVVGGAQVFVEHGFQRGGRPCPPSSAAQASEASPPARRPGTQSRKPGGIVTAPVLPLGTHLVAFAVERGDHLAHELACFIQYLLHQVDVHLGKGGQGLQLGRRVQNA
jgi:hypothetical protein